MSECCLHLCSVLDATVIRIRLAPPCRSQRAIRQMIAMRTRQRRMSVLTTAQSHWAPCALVHDTPGCCWVVTCSNMHILPTSAEGAYPTCIPMHCRSWWSGSASSVTKFSAARRLSPTTKGSMLSFLPFVLLSSCHPHFRTVLWAVSGMPFFKVVSSTGRRISHKATSTDMQHAPKQVQKAPGEVGRRARGNAGRGAGGGGCRQPCYRCCSASRRGQRQRRIRSLR